MTKDLLQINGITKSYQINGSKIIVLNKVTLDVHVNECICVFGKSGAGKTTLLNLIAGLINQDSGKINFSTPNPKIGYVFQSHRLFPWLTVSQNILLTTRANINLDTRQRKEKVSECLRLVKLEKHSHQYPGQLSGGELQKASLARALVISPDILLMDEPFSHLDEISATSLRTDFKNFIHQSKCKTVIMVTHNPFEAAYFADRIIILSKKNKGIKKTINVNFEKRDFSYSSFTALHKTQGIIKVLLSSIS